MPKQEICEVCFTFIAAKIASPLTTSEREKNLMSSTKSTQPLKHGDEPTELLIALASSPIETLIERGAAVVYTANAPDGTEGVLVFFANTRWAGGLVLATVGNGITNSSEAQ